MLVKRNCWEEVFTETVPAPKEILLKHEGLSSECTLEVVVEGKVVVYKLNRRMLFGLMAQTAKALHEMEPGRWVSPYEAQAAQDESA